MLSDSSGGFWTYILENPTGRFYIGHTDNLDRRLEEHNADHGEGRKYTLKHGPWHLVWKEAQATRAEAMRRERFIKSRKSASWIRRYLLNGGASPDVRRD